MRVYVNLGGPRFPVFQVLDPPGLQTFWERIDVDLTPFSGGPPFMLEWEFDTVNAANNAFAGWYVDSILVDDVAPPSDAVTIAPVDISPATAGRGQADVGMARLDASVAGFGSSTLYSVTVNLTGAPPLDSDVAAVRIWADDGDTLFDPFSDTLLDSGTFSGGVATLFPGWPLSSFFSQSLFISYDIAGGAGLGDRVATAFFSDAQFVVSPPDVASCVGCPFDTDDGVKTLITGGAGGDNVTFTPMDLAPASAAQGALAVVMGALDVGVDANTAIATAVTVDLTGFPPNPADVTFVTAWEDNGDSVFNAGMDTILGVGSYGAGTSATIPFGLGMLVVAGTNKTLWITYDISGTAGVGNYVGLYVGNDSSLQVAVPDVATCASLGCPMDTYTPGTDTVITGTGDTLAAAPSDAAPLAVMPNDQDVLMMNVTAGVNANSATLTSLTVTRTGTGTDADISAVDLWQDDGDLAFDPLADTLLYTSALAAGDATLAAGVTVTFGTPELFFISYDVAPLATPGTYFGAMIDSSTDVVVAAPDSGVCAGCPVDTYAPGTKTFILTPPNTPPEAVSIAVDGFAPATPGILHILTANPLLSWDILDADGDAGMDYEVRVSSAPGFSGDVWMPLPAGAWATSVAYGGPALVDATDYYFGVAVFDGTDWSPFNETLFHTNAPPPVPTTPITPLDLALIPASGAQTVTWTAGGTDPDGDPYTYNYEVALDPGFVTLVDSGSVGGTASNAFATSPMADYYWRVQADDAWEASGWSAVWLFTTNAAPMAIGLTVDGFPDASAGILHVLTAAPTLAWAFSDPDGGTQTQYQARVGSGPGLGDLFDTGVLAGATSSVPYGGPALSDATNYWFNVIVHDGTEWSAPAEVLFHTNGVPAAPTTPITPGQDATVAAGSQAVSWTGALADADGDAVTFQYEVATDTAFTTVVDSGSVTGGTVSPAFPTLPLTDYYWRVSATDGYETSAYGNDPPGYWHFSTSATVNNPPEARGLMINGSPAGSAGAMHVLGTAPLYAWTYTDPENDAQTDYDIRIGTTLGGVEIWAPGPVGVPALTATHLGPALLPGTDYYLGVRVHDGTSWSQWNDTLFHTNAPPPAPVAPTVPVDGSTVSPGGQTVTWTSGGPDTEGDTVTFTWEISTNAAFTIIVHTNSGTGLTSDSFTTNPGATYYWRVWAGDGLESSAYGNMPTGYWWFNTSGVNAPPVASAPGVDGYLDGTAGILHILGPTPLLNWTYADPDGGGQVEYAVQVGSASMTSDLWNPGSVSSAAGSVTYNGSGLSDGVDYWFGVRVSDGTDWSGWVEVMFRLNTPPPAPTLNTPADGLTGVSATTTLTWASVTDADSDAVQYHWEISASATFATLLDSGTVSGTSATPTGLAAGTQYFWRVRANDSWELGAFSLEFEFTTATSGATLGSVTVHVTDASGNDLANATVTLLDASGNAVGSPRTTPASGRVTFTSLTLGAYSVTVTATGYESGTGDTNLTASTPDRTITVQLTGTTVQPGGEFPWWLLILLVVLLVNIILFFLLRRKKPAPEEAATPPAAPAEVPPAAAPAEEELPPPADEVAPEAGSPEKPT
jgi:phosphodiesterase/alkaline phosphatase D-like protein